MAESDKQKEIEKKAKELDLKGPISPKPSFYLSFSMQNILGSPFLKTVLTIIFLITIFSATFIVSYLFIQKQKRVADIDIVPESEIILPEKVKGLKNYDEQKTVTPPASCLEKETKMLEEIVNCETISEKRCQELKVRFDKCVFTCLRQQKESGFCINICRPKCSVQIE